MTKTKPTTPHLLHARFESEKAAYTVSSNPTWPSKNLFQPPRPAFPGVNREVISTFLMTMNGFEVDRVGVTGKHCHCHHGPKRKMRFQGKERDSLGRRRSVTEAEWSLKEQLLANWRGYRPLW